MLKETSLKIFSCLAYPAMITDPNAGSILYVNQPFTDLTGFYSADVVGQKPPFSFWPQDRQPEYAKTWLNNPASKMEWMILGKNRESLWVERSVSMIREDDQRSYTVITLIEITKQKKLEESLRFSEEKFSQFFNAVPVPLAIATYPEMRFIDVNDHFVEHSGYQKSYFIGRPVSPVGPSENTESNITGAKGTIQTENNAVEIQFQSKEGELRTSLLNTRKMKLEGKDYIIAASIDITERKKMEEVLKASEQRYHSTLENMQEGCQIIGFDWRILFLNSMAARQGRNRKEDLLDRKLMDAFPGIEKTRQFAAMRDCMENRRSHRVEHEYKYSKKESGWFDMYIHPVDEGIFILTVDVTERKTDKDEIERLQIQQQYILDNIPDMAWIKDTRGRFIAVNKAMGTSTGVPPEAMLGKKDSDYYPAELAESYRADDLKVMETGVGKTIEEAFSGKEKIQWIETIKTPVFDKSGKVMGTVGIARDITKRKKTEQDLKNTNRVLRAIRDINQVITREIDPQKILVQTCKSLVESRGYHSCWAIGINENRKALYLAEYGIGVGFKPLAASLNNGIFPKCVQQALSEKQVVTFCEGETLCRDCPTYIPVEKGAYIAVVPICYKEKVWGAFFVLTRQDININDEELKLLNELARDLGMAMERLEIEEKKTAVESRLKESEERLRRISEIAQDAIYRVISGLYIEIDYISPAIEKILGYKPEEILYRRNWLEEITHPDDIPTVQRFLESREQTAGNSVTVRWRHKDGHYVWIEDSVSKIHDEKGNLVSTIGVARDVSERKRIEESLKQSQLYNASLLNNTPTPLIVINPDSTIRSVNPAFERITGFSSDEITGAQAPYPWWSDDQAAKYDIERGTAFLKRYETRERMCRKKNGETFWITTFINHVKEDDEVKYYLISWVDITERKKMEKQIVDLYENEKKQKEELQTEAKARGMFIDVLAHELRTPLTPILASAGLLSDLLQSQHSEIQKKLCSNIEFGAETLVTRLEELLELAKYARGTFKLRKRSTDLDAFLRGILNRFEPTLKQKNQRLNDDLADNLPAVMVDPLRLEQVISNLLSNASKFSPEKGEMSIRAFVEGTNFMIEVRDQGIGISRSEQSRLFQPYHRVEQDRLKFPGLGLGLAISKQIVEAHGGRIWVESDLGKGSLFCISIPLSRPG
ncbi:MAG: PAS domain S-box protein [Dehalococcoidales bacterium]|nr:PAS domain S-box protein [Dehalococcoidales bacterium]